MKPYIFLPLTIACIVAFLLVDGSLLGFLLMIGYGAVHMAHQHLTVRSWAALLTQSITQTERANKVAEEANAETRKGLAMIEGYEAMVETYLKKQKNG